MSAGGFSFNGPGTNNGTPNAITLTETTTSQTTLQQAFTLGAKDRYLSFTVDNANLHGAGSELQSAPADAFEVALLDATTYQPLLDNSGTNGVGALGWTHSNAALNLQHSASSNVLQARKTANITVVCYRVAARAPKIAVPTRTIVLPA